MRQFTVSVTVRAGTKTRGIQINKEGGVTVKTTTPPEKGKANKDVVDMLAEHFGVPKSQVILIKGATSKQKIFKIMA